MDDNILLGGSERLVICLHLIIGETFKSHFKAHLNRDGKDLSRERQVESIKKKKKKKTLKRYRWIASKAFKCNNSPWREESNKTVEEND